jgi:hypothetical protein
MSASRALMVAGYLLIAIAASASPISNSTITVINGSTPYNSTWGWTNAIDTGGNYHRTDYASLGAGNNAFLDFDLGQQYPIYRIIYTDRTSSGGNNDSYLRGTLDYVTGFQFLFSNDPTFGTVLGSVQVTGILVPPSGSALPNFQHAVDIPGGYNARYVRWDVISHYSGSATHNTGASNFQFETPEPSTFALLAGGLALAAALKRRRA